MTGGLAADAGLHLDLPAPRMLIYGEQNNTHSYLPALTRPPVLSSPGSPSAATHVRQRPRDVAGHPRLPHQH
jgi:hypothetical protein